MITMRRFALLGVAALTIAVALYGVVASLATSEVHRWAQGTTVVKSPLGRRFGPALAPAGSEIIVFGGVRRGSRFPSSATNDGAILNLQTAQWSKIAPAPFRLPLDPPAAVWTGRELVVLGAVCVKADEFDEGDCGGTRLAGAVYTRPTDSWRVLRLPAVYRKVYGGISAYPLLWTGTEALFWDGTDRYIAFSPQTDRFRTFKPPTFGINLGATCIAGRHVVVVGFAAGPTLLYVLDENASHWNTGAQLPKDFPRYELTTCTRRSAILASYDLSQIVRYSIASKQWIPVSSPADRVAGAYYRASGHGDVVDFWIPGDPHGLRFDTVHHRWSAITGGPSFQMEPGLLVWVRGLAATYGERFPGTPGDLLVIYRPR